MPVAKHSMPKACVDEGSLKLTVANCGVAADICSDSQKGGMAKMHGPKTCRVCVSTLALAGPCTCHFESGNQVDTCPPPLVLQVQVVAQALLDGKTRTESRARVTLIKAGV